MQTPTRTSTTRTGSTLRGIAVGLALLVTAAACADGDNGDTDTDDPADVEETVEDESDDGDEDAAEDDAAADDAGTAGDAVSARNINFEPAELDVAVGTTVTFTNEDIVRHTVTAGSPDDVGDAFDEELDGEGDTVTITFDDEGTFEYFCRLHPSMTGTITVG